MRLKPLADRARVKTKNHTAATSFYATVAADIPTNGDRLQVKTLRALGFVIFRKLRTIARITLLSNANGHYPNRRPRRSFAAGNVFSKTIQGEWKTHANSIAVVQNDYRDLHKTGENYAGIRKTKRTNSKQN